MHIFGSEHNQEPDNSQSGPEVRWGSEHLANDNLLAVAAFGETRG